MQLFENDQPEDRRNILDKINLFYEVNAKKIIFTQEENVNKLYMYKKCKSHKIFTTSSKTNNYGIPPSCSAQRRCSLYLSLL